MAEHDFKVDWISRSKIRGPVDRTMGPLLQGLRDKLAPQALGLSISYVDDRIMRKLNREHRGMDSTTDVLSFPSETEPGAYPHLGDIVISLPVADKMAKKLGISRRREVQTLVIHGFLHLVGYDHEKDSGEMMALQAQLETELIGDEPLPMSLKRGRKPGTKVKVLKDGSRVVVAGRAARALERKAAEKKQAEKEAKVAERKARTAKGKEKVAAVPARKPGRPRKVVETPAPVPAAAPAKRVVRKRKPTRVRSGVIA